MRHIKIFQILLFIVVMATVESNLQNGNIKRHLMQHIASKTPINEQESAVIQLIERTIPKYKNYFKVTINTTYFARKDNLDAFQLSNLQNNGISIIATSGVAAASGFYHYVKYYCYGHISWSGNQLNVPDLPPTLPNVIIKNFQERYRYYQNVCTVSYSMVFWNWTRWEQEIDWMAMNAINFPLAFTAQETIWRMVYTKLGLTQQELDGHFAGPAFLAWQRMGNLDAWGGPLPNSWYNQQLNLQHNILKRMRSLGMIPVLPGFAGHIPKPLVDRLYPNAKFYKLGVWNGFTGPYGGTYLLDAQDPLYQQIGSMFIKMQQEVYNGTDHVYNADVFNEMTPPELTPDYINRTSAAIYNAMHVADSEAVWLMQGWMFLSSYWTNLLIKTWLTALPLGRIIILDLASDINPIFIRANGYFGHPYIWCMIENFGGNTRLYGKNQDNINNVLKTRRDPNYNVGLIGTGMTPEGINQNDVDFEIMNELAWRNEAFNLSDWSRSYSRRRYGVENSNFEEAWSILIEGLYNSRTSDSNGDRNHLLIMRPHVIQNYTVHIWYDQKQVFNAWVLMTKGCKDLQTISDSLIHDIAKLGSQVIEDMLTPVYNDMINAFNNKSLNALLSNGHKFLDMINDIDTLLATDRYSLLGNWIESAKRLGVNKDEKNILEFNARNQITLWGPTGQITDYANKNWAGLVSSYYLKRWYSLLIYLQICLDLKQPYNDPTYFNDVMKFQLDWNHDNAIFPTHPVGDVIALSEKLIKKYTTL